MRGAGVSGAGIASDLSGTEDEAGGEMAPDMGGEATPPDTATDQTIGGGAGGGGAATDQTI
jgi:hypothetical protein